MKLISSLLIVYALAVGWLYYVNYSQEPVMPLNTGLLGSTITTINGSDTIKNSRTTINDNFTALNNGKFELTDWFATTSAPQLVTLSGLTTAGNLATVGTITSGVWNGTAITASKGGTGSTTLMSNALLLGNGTNPIIGLGNGTAGQFLTASTTGNAPYWSTSAIDEAGNYTWTGNHIFASTTIDGVHIEIGTGANELIKLNSSSKLPAVDGSQLTNVNRCVVGWETRAINTGAGSQEITTGINQSIIRVYSARPDGAGGNNYISSGVYDVVGGITSTVRTKDSAVATSSSALIYLYDGGDITAGISTTSPTSFTLSWSTTPNSGTTYGFRWEACK